MSDLKLDLDFVRSHFPQLENGWAFFENAGGSYVPISVAERISRYLYELQIQPGGQWPQSQLAADMIAEGHQAMASFVNAQPEEVLIGPSTTMNVYVLSNALSDIFEPGDEIIVTNQDHESNIGAWRRLSNKGVVVKEWCVNPETAELQVDDLEALLCNKTKLVCFPHVSNIVGTINDVVEITRIVHAAGALVCVDGVAYAAHRSVDVKAWDVDFYLLSLYKVYGPHLGLLYGKKGLMLELSNQNHYFFPNDALPAKLNPGGQQHELAAALLGIVEYFESLHAHHIRSDQTCSQKDRVNQVYELIAEQEQVLLKSLLDYLCEKPQIRIIGSARADQVLRVPTISFRVEGYAPGELAAKLSASSIALRHGHFYAHRLMKSLGLLEVDGVVRCSLLHYNTVAEVGRFRDALDVILR